VECGQSGICLSVLRRIEGLTQCFRSFRTKVSHGAGKGTDTGPSWLRDGGYHPVSLRVCIRLSPPGLTLTEGSVKTASDSPRIWRYFSWTGSSGSATNLRSSVRITVTEAFAKNSNRYFHGFSGIPGRSWAVQLKCQKVGKSREIP